MSQKQDANGTKIKVRSNALIPFNMMKAYDKLFPHQMETVNWMLNEFEKASTAASAGGVDYPQTRAFREFLVNRGLLIGHAPGLGKTPISCFFLSVLFARKMIRFACIVVQKTLIEQWRAHIQKWCPNAVLVVYSGGKRDMEALNLARAKQGILLTTYRTAELDADNLERRFSKKAKECFEQAREVSEKLKKQQHPVETQPASNYAQIKDKLKEFVASSSSDKADSSTLQDEDESMREQIQERVSLDSDSSIQQITEDKTLSYSPFRNCAFDVMIFDEATEIKNAATSVHKHLTEISSFFRVALTGTPIMNNIKEMFNIVDFCNPGFFGTRSHFVKYFDKPINQSRLKDATPYQRAIGRIQSVNLVAALRPIFLRYTKEQVNAVDSTKTEIILWMSLNSTQLQLYDAFINSKRFEMQLQADLQNKMVPFQLITILRKICENMMRLNQQEINFLDDDARVVLEHEQRRYMRLLGGRFTKTEFNVDSDEELSTATSAAKAEQIRNNYFNQESTTTTRESVFDHTLETINATCSVKQHVLTQLVTLFQERKLKTLIFTEHTTTLNLIQLQLDDLGISYLRIDGSVASAVKRNEICSNFNNGSVSCLLMTIKVGGMGLNLQGARRVIIFSPHWNPSVEEQAIARAYRIGQEHDVVVYKLIVRNTIEEKLVARQYHKLQVATQVMSDINAKLKVQTSEIQHLFERRPAEVEKIALGNIEEMRVQLMRELLANEARRKEISQRFIDKQVARGEIAPLADEYDALYDRKEVIRRLLPHLTAEPLELTINRMNSFEEIDIGEEKEVLKQIQESNQGYALSASLVSNTRLYKNQIEETGNDDDDQVAEEINTILTRSSGVCKTIEELRNEFIPEVEPPLRQPARQEGPTVVPELQNIFDQRLSKKSKESEASDELRNIFELEDDEDDNAQENQGSEAPQHSATGVDELTLSEDAQALQDSFTDDTEAIPKVEEDRNAAQRGQALAADQIISISSDETVLSEQSVVDLDRTVDSDDADDI